MTLPLLLLGLAAVGAAAQCTHAPVAFSFAPRPTYLLPLLSARGCADAPGLRWAAMAGAGLITPGQILGKTKKGTPGHIFFIIPAYNVEYIKNVPPLTSHEKLDEFIEDAYDPIGLAASAFEAAVLEHDSTGFCGYGPGWGGYGKCYGAALLDANISGFVGDYMMPSILHQDPRYFRLGQGSVGGRLFYALTRVFIMRKDAGGWTFGSGAMMGTLATGALSNLYYPKADRGWGLSLSRMGIDLGGAAIFNCEAEFWPDIVGWFKGKH